MDGIESERPNIQLGSPLTSRQKSASPQVHSGAIPICLIVPSDLRVAVNNAPQDRHFAKHRETESCSAITVLVILSHSSNGCWDVTGNWLVRSNRALTPVSDAKSVSNPKKTPPSSGLANPTTSHRCTAGSYSIAGLCGILSSNGSTLQGAGRQEGMVQRGQRICRPLDELVSRRIIYLPSSTSTRLPFTDTVFFHTVASRHPRCP